MAEYYRANFTVESSCSDPEVGGIELMSMVQNLVYEWARRKRVEPVEETRNRGWKGADGATFQVEMGQLDKAGFCRLVLEHSDDSVADTTWRSNFRISTEGEGVVVDVEIRCIYEGVESHGATGNANRPRVLVELLQEFQCSSEGRPLTIESERIQKQGAGQFAREMVINPSRRVPAVVVTENYYGGVFMDPDRLQSRLLGLANVFTYDNGTARVINSEISDWLGCWDGTVRVYRPGCSLDDASRQNVYWTWGRMNSIISRRGWEELLTEISDECLRHSLPQSGQRSYDEVAGLVRQARYEGLLKRFESAAQDESTYQELLTEATGTVSDYQSQVNELRRRNVELENRNSQLRAEVEQLNIALSYTDPEDLQPEGTLDDSMQPEFDSVYDVVEHASEHMNGVRFFVLAEQMAKGSQFPRPNEVYSVFQALEKCAAERLRGPLGMDVQDWLSERGVDYAPHESQTTMGKHGDKRIFYDNAKKHRTTMEAHVKLGGGLGEHNQLRIHLIWDEMEEKWLVGYIGRHLPTASG